MPGNEMKLSEVSREELIQILAEYLDTVGYMEGVYFIREVPNKRYRHILMMINKEFNHA